MRHKRNCVRPTQAGRVCPQRAAGGGFQRGGALNQYLSETSRTAAILDCGDKRNATPLSECPHSQPKRRGALLLAAVQNFDCGRATLRTDAPFLFPAQRILLPKQ